MAKRRQTRFSAATGVVFFLSFCHAAGGPADKVAADALRKLGATRVKFSRGGGPLLFFSAAIRRSFFSCLFAMPPGDRQAKWRQARYESLERPE